MMQLRAPIKGLMQPLSWIPICTLRAVRRISNIHCKTVGFNSEGDYSLLVTVRSHAGILVPYSLN
jgi:hypothetical protein